MNILNRLIDPPSFQGLSFKEHQKRRFYNRGNLYGACCCLLFTVLGFWAGLNHLAYLTLFNMGALITGVYANHHNKFELGRHISLMGSLSLFVALNYFYGNIARTEIYLFIFPVVINMMFDKKSTIIFYCILLFSLFVLCLYLQRHFSGVYDGDVTYLRKISYFNYLFGFFMLSFMFYSFKSENLQYSAQIEEQKNAIEEKNAEITASITYAKRLQDAILPPVNTIKSLLPESFVLYKPKDIVAGDFYWMAAPPLRSTTGEITGHTVFIAACDCTGHGVPGAMVSLVCSNALNRAVKEFGITEPGKVLDKTRELVLETFSQRDSTGKKYVGDINDGMDISLAAIIVRPHPDSPQLGRLKASPVGREGADITIQWAGAYNPLWYMENGELKEITGDKQPVGKHDNPKPFTTHTITLSSQSERGATFYLFTDGYADQFGGERGKKFKYKQLQELIKNNHHLPVDVQKQTLEQTLESWRGNLEQVDDILIMGIRV